MSDTAPNARPTACAPILTAHGSMRPCSNAASASRFKGVERNNVQEYCVSEGWVRVTLGAKVDRKGRPLTNKLSGPVEAYFRE